MECAVPGCAAEWGDEYQKHIFPRSKVRRAIWMRFCGITEAFTGAKFICSRHFKEDSYQYATRIKAKSRLEWRLNDRAVPTLFPPDWAEEEEEEGDADLTEYTVPEPVGSDTIEIEMTLDDLTEIESVAIKCRLCLGELDQNALNMFEVEEGKENSSISVQLLEIFQLELQNSPEWPSYICLQCVDTVALVKQFKDKIMASHCSLYNLIVERKKEEEEAVELPPEEPQVGHTVEIITVKEEEEEEVEEKIFIPESQPTPIGTLTTTHAELPPIESLMHTLNLLKCKPCFANFPDYPAFENHMRAEHGVESCYVRCCNQVRFGQLGLLDHLQYHLDANSYICQKCLRRFDSKSNLIRHTKKNHPSPRFQCSTCGKICLSQFKLSDHMATHLSKAELPQQCNHCPKRFATVQSVKRHAERMHGEVMEPRKAEMEAEDGESEERKRYPCLHCNKMSETQQGMYLHILRSHPKEYEKIAQKRSEK